MKAQDLRIGNYVVVMHNVQKVTQILEKGLNCGNVGCLYSLVEPIPLTEEWLIKFGFDKLHGNWFDNGGVIELSEKDNGYVMLEDSYYHCSQDLLYVHQLQNLYFALIGEELTFKEPA